LPGHGQEAQDGCQVNVVSDGAIRPARHRALPDAQDGRQQVFIETTKAPIRTKGEHPFLVIEQQFGFQKTQLRDLAKDYCRVGVIAALTNLFLVRRHLLL
jgi:IS5 family transposase